MAENGDRDTAASRARVGSLRRPQLGIYFPLHPSFFIFRTDNHEVTVLASESGAAS